MRIRLASLMLVLAACSSDLAPGAGNATGTGSRTLGVSGWVMASPRMSNAASADDFDIDFSVRIELNNQTVTNGEVTVTSSSGKVALTFQGNPRGGSSWTGSATGYDEVYVLDVVSGVDRIDGARVDGPDIHTFTQPAEGATIDASMPLMLAWTRDRAADQASLRADGSGPTRIGDTGSYTLPAGTLHPDRLQARRHTIDLSRTNSVTPAGAISGSSWDVTIDNEIDVITPPLPL